MDLSNGKYLDNEICAFSNDWIIIKNDTQHSNEGIITNYMLFTLSNRCICRHDENRLPTNDVASQTKDVEYYTTFDNAVKNLCKVVANKGFLTKSRVIK